MRNRFAKKSRPKEEMNLQITSMADVFTIILVFLLKTFSTSISGITVNNVALPVVKAASEAAESLKVEIGQGSILIDGHAVTHLAAFKFDATDLEKDGTPRSLNTALIQEMRQQKERVHPLVREPASVTQVTQVTPETLLILADKQAPYSVLKTVLASASNAGFSDFRLVVVEDR